MKKFIKNKIWILISVCLLLLNFYLFTEILNLKNENLYFVKAVPDIEIGGVMVFYGTPTSLGKTISKTYEGLYAYGEINGFVVFNDISQQPKNLRQYYTIKSSQEFDEKGNQIFYLEETIKMSAVAPRKFDAEKLFVIDDSSSFITLESENGSIIKINKLDNSVVLDNNEARLITSRSEFKDFIVDLYK